MEGKRGMGAQRSGVPCLKSPSKSIAGVGTWECGCTFILPFSSLRFRSIMTVVIQHEGRWHSHYHSGCDACVFSFPSSHSLHSLYDPCCFKFDILDRVMQENCVISGITECLGSDWSIHLLWAAPAHPSHTYIPGSPSLVCGFFCLCVYVTEGKWSPPVLLAGCHRYQRRMAASLLLQGRAAHRWGQEPCEANFNDLQ